MEGQQSPVALAEPDLRMRMFAPVEPGLRMVVAMLENMRMSRDEKV